MASRKRGNKARARAAGEGTEGSANEKRDAAQTSTSENAVTPLQVRRARAAPSALLSTNQCQVTRYRPLWCHQVALYWPNIIGYYRFVLLLAAMAAHVVGRPGFCIIAWFTSCALDFFDGIAARAFNQVCVAGGVGKSQPPQTHGSLTHHCACKYVCVSPQCSKFGELLDVILDKYTRTHRCCIAHRLTNLHTTTAACHARCFGYS